MHVHVSVPNGECSFRFSIDIADFNRSLFTLTFEAGESQCQCVQISIEDDSIYENSEMFHVLLENITSDVTVAMGMSSVIILDCLQCKLSCMNNNKDQSFEVYIAT